MIVIGAGSIGAGTCAPGVAGLGAGAVDAALRQQLLALDRIAGRLAVALTVLPSDGSGVWSGDARRMYVHALRQLSAQLHSASAHIDDAIRDTRHALAALAGEPHGR